MSPAMPFRRRLPADEDWRVTVAIAESAQVILIVNAMRAALGTWWSFFGHAVFFRVGKWAEYGASPQRYSIPEETPKNGTALPSPAGYGISPASGKQFSAYLVIGLLGMIVVSPGEGDHKERRI